MRRIGIEPIRSRRFNVHQETSVKRRDVLTAASLLLPLRSVYSQPQGYPSRPVRWLNPFAAGSPIDVVGRKLAELAAPALRGRIVLESKPGASGSIATGEVARAVPDGYLFAIGTPDTLINVSGVLKTPGFDVRKDLTPVIQLLESQVVLFASATSGIKSYAQLIDAARAKPRTIAYGSYGNGTLPHLMMSVIEQETNTAFLHVPYKGLVPAMTDLVGGQIQLTVAPIEFAKQYIRQGSAVPLLVRGGTERSEGLPDVPTAPELGIRSRYMQRTHWIGLTAPANMNPEMLGFWYQLLEGISKRPDYKKFLWESQGLINNTKAPDVFARDIALEFADTMDLMRRIGIEPA